MGGEQGLGKFRVFLLTLSDSIHTRRVPLWTGYLGCFLISDFSGLPACLDAAHHVRIVRTLSFLYILNPVAFYTPPSLTWPLFDVITSLSAD